MPLKAGMHDSRRISSPAVLVLLNMFACRLPPAHQKNYRYAWTAELRLAAQKQLTARPEAVPAVVCCLATSLGLTYKGSKQQQHMGWIKLRCCQYDTHGCSQVHAGACLVHLNCWIPKR